MKKIGAFLITVMMILSVMAIFPVSGFAESIEQEKEYKPLDLVVVLDTSGSMKFSDKNRTAPAAVRMLVNLIPAQDGRVAVVGFNKKPTVLTQSSDGKSPLVSLVEFDEVANVVHDVEGVEYDGGTGIGNAVFEATQILKNHSNNDHTKAIILFTDGTNDFDNDKMALAKCDDNEAKAIQWAQKNDCVIYCMGYDYKTSKGVSSMGAKGEGIKKLKNIAFSTNGRFEKINSAKQMQGVFIDFLADVLDINVEKVGHFPADGEFHECEIEVGPTVIEANIRLSGGDKNSIKNGKLHLYDPSGKEIKLQNTRTTRFDVDATAANIKIIVPAPGKWRLTVDDVKGDDEVLVTLLSHYNMNLKSKLEFPSGNPKGVAYTGDKIGIKTWLTYKGQDLDETAIYDAVTSAKAVCVPRANKNDKKIVTLERKDNSFVGSFTIPQDCYYDIYIRIDWDSVYREDVLEIASSNKPPEVVGEIKDVKVRKNKTLTVPSVYQYVKDEENDEITAEVSAMNPDAADLKLVDDSIQITGRKMTSTVVTVTYSDPQGNDVSTSFKVRVYDPWVYIISIGSIVLIALAVLMALWISYEKSLKIKGDLTLLSIQFDGTIEETLVYEGENFAEGDDELIDLDVPVLSLLRPYKYKNNRNLKYIIDKFIEMLETYKEKASYVELARFLRTDNIRSLMKGSELAKIKGTPVGNQFTIKVNKKTPHISINKSSQVTVSSGDRIDIQFIKKDSSGNKNRLIIKMKFRSKARTPKSSKKKRR